MKKIVLSVCLLLAIRASAADLSVLSFGKVNNGSVSVVVSPSKAGVKVFGVFIGSGKQLTALTDATGTAKFVIPTNSKALFVTNLAAQGDNYRPNNNKVTAITFN